MKYEKIIKGNFIERPNRFVAIVETGGKKVTAHVKNTGRCRELLVPGATVYLEDFEGRMGSIKLKYSLIGVEKGNITVNMDSQAPNKIIKESLESGSLALPEMESLVMIKPEAVYGESRLDFYVKDCKGREGYIEVKGVTLETCGIAMFPDAPTERGIKHLHELQHAVGEGKKAFIIFVIQMKGVLSFEPNDERHKAFGDALREAACSGVTVLAYDCMVGEDFISLGDEVRSLNI